MFSHKRRLVVAQRAQRDIRSIELYTLSHWGPEQARDYKARIDELFELLIENPNQGRSRAEHGNRVMSIPIQHHILFYRVNRDALVILRILHERADPA